MTDAEHPFAGIAAELIGLPGLLPSAEEAAIVAMLHGIVGPRLVALATCDIAAMAPEVNLDPGREPRDP